MPPFGPKLIDAVERSASRADRLLDRVRKTPRRRLDAVPEPIEPPDPFVQAKPGAPAATEEAPLGDVGIAAQVYGRRTDPWSGRALRLLRDRGVEVRFVDLDEPEHRTLEVRLVRETKQAEVPWVFVRGELVGGFQALDELARLGQLDDRLLPPGDRPKARPSRVRIVAPRTGAEAPPPVDPSADPTRDGGS